MFKSSQFFIAFALLLLTFGCQEKEEKSAIAMDEVFAWCIVPFDSEQRSPQERIDMLKELGINRYAYDWRQEHLAETAMELKLAQENDIEVNAIWMWIDNNQDSLANLSDSNEKIFEAIIEANYSGQLWLGFNANFFDDLSDVDAIKKGSKMIAYLSQRAKAVNCKVALYNHGDWFGEPANQVKIIETLPNEDLGIIFNFHHAHPQMERFSEVVDVMLPYLWSVNLNGMNADGPKILTIGKGEQETAMIQMLLDKGYTGDFGILGHLDEDVKLVLERNLAGLRALDLTAASKAM